MVINQLSVFLENKPGRLAAVLETLAQNDVDISSLNLAEASDYGVLRLIVSDPDKGQKALTESGVVVRITQMVAIAVDDTPGGAARVAKVLSQNNIEIEYMYACIGMADGKALMVCRVQNVARAEQVLEEYGMNAHKLKEIYRI